MRATLTMTRSGTIGGTRATANRQKGTQAKAQLWRSHSLKPFTNSESHFSSNAEMPGIFASDFVLPSKSLLAPDFRIRFVGVKNPADDVLIEQALIIYTASSAESAGPTRYVTPGGGAGVLYVNSSHPSPHSPLARQASWPKRRKPTGTASDAMCGAHHMMKFDLHSVISLDQGLNG